MKQASVAERVERLEGQIDECLKAFGRIQETQDEILENDRKLFEIHAHNDGYLKEIHEAYTQLVERVDGRQG